MAPGVDVADVRLGASYGALILASSDSAGCSGFDQAGGCTLFVRDAQYRIEHGVVVGVSFPTRYGHRLPFGLTAASSRQDLVSHLDGLGVAYEDRSDGDYQVVTLPCVRATSGVRYRIAFTFRGGALRIVTEREA